MSGVRRAALAVVVVAFAAGCGVESDDDEQALLKAPTTAEEAREWREANPVPPPPAPAPQAAPPAAPGWSFGNGSYEVGRDIQPGTYRSLGPSDSALPLCSFARLRTAGASISDIDEVIDLQVIQEGQAIVNIAPTGGGFFSQGCQPWEPR